MVTGCTCLSLIYGQEAQAFSPAQNGQKCNEIIRFTVRSTRTVHTNSVPLVLLEPIAELEAVERPLIKPACLEAGCSKCSHLMW